MAPADSPRARTMALGDILYPQYRPTCRQRPRSLGVVLRHVRAVLCCAVVPPVHAAHAGLVEANEVKAQSGNPAFLATIFDGIRLEARLTGTEAPREQRLDGQLRLETDLVARLHAGRQRVVAARTARDGRGD